MKNKIVDEFKSKLKFYILVILVGLVAGVGSILFRQLIAFFHNSFFYGQLSFTYDMLEHARPSPWQIGIIFVPVIGAFFVAYLVKNFAPEARGHGVPEAIDAIHYEHGYIRPVVALIKSVASSITIGSGGSVGREGPIIQIGAAFGSTIAQWVKVPEWERITLIATGAGAGIAATFNAPLGGVLFAIEIMLLEFSVRTLIPVILGSTIATYISYLQFGDYAFIPVNTTALSHLHLPLAIACVIISLLLGVFSTIFIKAIYLCEDLFDCIPGGYYVRHLSGMLLVGISMYLMLQLSGHYYIQGVGYATVMDILNNSLLNPKFLILLAVLKLANTAITLGSGGSGGIFSPLLYIGACLGGCFALFYQQLYPNQLEISIQLGALVGIAGMIGASTGALLTAIVMTTELTSDYTIILPLMLIVSLSFLVRRLFIKESIYTLKLVRRGHPIPEIFSRR